MAIKLNINRKDVGEFVCIQVFERHPTHDGMIVQNSLQVFVGKLQAYRQDKNTLTFSIKGLRAETINLKKQYIEVYVVDKEK